MKLNAIGLNIRHIGDFCIDRPNGSSDYLLLVFKTGAYFYDGQKKTLLPPDSCILYRKGTKQWYGTTGKTYVNHYLHFNCDNESSLLQTGIPFDTPFFLTNPAEVEEIFRMLNKEHISDNSHKEENLSLLIQLLLQKISDAAAHEPPTENVRRQEEFINLRAEIYSNAGIYNRIDELANSVNLSSSHFQMLYQKTFGISCYDDLLTAKTMQAQHHLKNTPLPIKEVARVCGYENETCFMRCFKKRTGLTPTQYRNTK